MRKPASKSRTEPTAKARAGTLSKTRSKAGSKTKADISPRGTDKSTSTEQHVVFRELLHQTRLVNGLTQAVVSARLQKPQSFIAKIENGERRLDAVELIAYAKAIDADPVVLFRKLAKAIEKLLK